MALNVAEAVCEAVGVGVVSCRRGSVAVEVLVAVGVLVSVGVNVDRCFGWVQDLLAWK